MVKFFNLFTPVPWIFSPLVILFTLNLLVGFKLNFKFFNLFFHIWHAFFLIFENRYHFKNTLKEDKGSQMFKNTHWVGQISFIVSFPIKFKVRIYFIVPGDFSEVRVLIEFFNPLLLRFLEVIIMIYVLISV